MFIGHKANTILAVAEVEWMCRSACKKLYIPEYWTWIETITSGDPPVVDYSGETGYTIVECTDENVEVRLNQLGDYQSSSPETGTVYNIKWSDSKVSAVTGQDMAGEDITIQTHFSGDDTAKDARLLVDEWTLIRAERDSLLTSTDWTQGNDTPLSDANTAKWTTYRGKLRTLPADQSSKTKYSQVTWPTKP